MVRPTSCLSLVHDIVTAGASVADVVFDILVAREFYQDGRFGFFYASVCIFLVAQAAYSFLFAAAYAGHRSPGQRLFVFAVSFPLAQAIPLFAWLESLEVPCLLRAMRRFGLRPSIDGQIKAASSESDSLWLAFRAKYAAHSGFLAEAVVEAMPQCALQAAAALIAGELSALNLISILLSVGVIASKGWCVSYSLHRPTLAFNSLCVAADVLALFGAICLVFAPPLPSPFSGGGETSTLWSLLVALCSSLRGITLLVVGLCLCLAIGAGALLLLAVMADDALCHRRKRMQFDDPIFEIVVLHPVSFMLSLLPWCARLLPALP